MHKIFKSQQFARFLFKGSGWHTMATFLSRGSVGDATGICQIAVVAIGVLTCWCSLLPARPSRALGSGRVGGGFAWGRWQYNFSGRFARLYPPAKLLLEDEGTEQTLGGLAQVRQRVGTCANEVVVVYGSGAGLVLSTSIRSAFLIQWRLNNSSRTPWKHWKQSMLS